MAVWDFAHAIFEHCLFTVGLANGGFFVSNCSPVIRGCDVWSGELQLASDSLCAERNNPKCGRIGAFGVGCQQTTVLAGSWGSITGLFR